MKKWIKILLGFLGVILFLLVLVLYYSISTIDQKPYFQTEYYKNTIEKLNKTISERKSTEGEFLAGISKMNITPKLIEGIQNPSKGEFNSIKLAGYGDGQFASGVHDSIYAKAIAMKVNENIAIFVSADLLLMPPEVVEKVEENLKDYSVISRKQVFFGATHTHASIGNCIPSYVGEEFGGVYQPEVVEWLGDKITKLVINSMLDLKESQFASGFIHAPELISNRIIGETGRLNDKLTVISIKQSSGENALIGIFAAHATTLGAWNNQFSGDYPGYFQRELENNGIDMAMFFAGTVGSHTNKSKGDKFDKSRYIGEALADSAKIILDKIEYTNKVSFSSIASEIEIPKLQMIYISDNLRLSPEVGHELMPDFKKTYLQAITLNNFLWLTMPCELSGEYAIDLQNALELRGFNSGITSFNGQYLGYVVPAKYYYYDTYEARLMGWFGPSMGDYIMELNYTIADSLTGFKL